MLSPLEIWKSLEDGRRLATAYRFLMEALTEDAERDDQFLSTDFSKWAYFRQKYKVKGLPASGVYQLRTGLKSYRKDPINFERKDELLLLIDDLLPQIIKLLIQGNGKALSLHHHFEFTEQGVQSWSQQNLRLLITEMLAEGRAEGEDEEGRKYKIQLPQVDIPGMDVTFSDLSTAVPTPFYIHAFDISEKDGVIIPEYFVLLPDYLVDVTAVASGFVSHDFVPWVYLNQKLTPRKTTYYMMLGNIVNSILDALIHNPDLTIDHFYPKIFQQHTVAIGKMEDDQVRKLMSDVQRHFNNLKRAIDQGFSKLDITLDRCTLEPSFLSNIYGLQGRLDVLFQGKTTSIIELKSGKPFRPNSYGIKTDHYIQTLLYDLLIKSAGISKSSRNFILYSSQEERPLRYAPPVKNLQVKALDARNQIVLMDMILQGRSKEQFERLFRTYFNEDLSRVSPFVARDVNLIKQVVRSSKVIDWKYYCSFLSFAQREVAVAKLGKGGQRHRQGHAGLWLQDDVTKDEEFNILKGLTPLKLDTEEPELVSFECSDVTNALANFRQGDVVVLYPDQGGDQDVLRQQVVKGSLLYWDQSIVKIRPRSAQFDTHLFQAFDSWNLERDMLDSSFRSMFENLLYFLAQSPEDKSKWLGVTPPKAPSTEPVEFNFSPHVLEDQKRVVVEAYNARDYYMIWGPPGTGKTNVVLRELLRMYYELTDCDIFLVAYTNRAVDEISGVALQLSDEVQRATVRLGSRYSIGEDYSHLLFRNQVGDIRNRSELSAYLNAKRVFISTLSSFWGQRELIRSKKKSVLIVDEASQILEPSIIGLLGCFDKVIFIGDHMQLPAVSVQSERSSKIEDEKLQEIGFENTKTSLFQRLYIRAEEEGWDHARGLLCFQGRMHEHIMDFVNGNFYKEQLRLLPGLDRLTASTSKDEITQRMIYIPSESLPFGTMLKNNADEAEKVGKFIDKWLKAKGLSPKDILSYQFGVITPFRAQIALIKSVLFKLLGSESKRITVDTVERYQGSARDVIIISTCLNTRGQLQTITSLTEAGIDRKMNVALTRAKEQVVIIGNRNLLTLSKSYAGFIDKAESIEL